MTAGAAAMSLDARIAELVAVSEHLAEGVLVIAPDGRIVHVNHVAADILGFDPSDSTVSETAKLFGVFAFAAPEGPPLDPRDWPVNRILRGETLRDEPVRVRRLDGSWERVVRCGGTLLREPDGEPVMAVVRMTDATEHVKMESGLQRTRERLELAINAANAGLWEWDVVGGRTWSDRNRMLYGLAGSEEASYEKWLSTIDPEDRDELVRAAEQAVAERREMRVEYRVRAPDGTTRWLMSRGEPICDENGKAVRFAGIILDITDRKRVEEVERERERQATLRASEARFRALIEKGADIIIVADEDLRITLWSPGATSVLGWSEEQWLGRSLRELAGPGDPLPENVLTDPGAAATFQLRCVHADGTERVLGVRMRNLFHDPAVKSIVLNATDLTEHLRTQHELQHAQKLEALGVLAGGLAHDFNNLLTSVFSHIDLAMLDLPSESEALEDLQFASSAIGAGRRLTQQLLTFARGGASVLVTCPVEPLVRKATGEVFGEESGKRFALEVDADLPLVRVDQGHLVQAIANVLRNAADATPAGGLVEARCSSRLIRGETFVQIVIRDNGEGIPPADLTRVFDPFFTTKPHSVGLGLATAYSIMKRHGGNIEIESQRGSGTTATLLLPVSRGREPSDPGREQAVPASCRVLVMDDEAALRRSTGLLLRRARFEVEVAADGAEAVRLHAEALASGRRFDVLLFDLTVPGGMGGVAALEEIRKIDPDVRAIASSGYAHDEILARPREFGFQAALAKPYTRQELLHAVATASSSSIRVVGG